MFTIDQISEAHSKVKSGADFPRYIQELIGLGIKSYETLVADGHTVYRGKDDLTVQSEVKYAKLAIADQSNGSRFRQDLKDHQQGRSDYFTFCLQCAGSGVEKWIVDMERMTCTYYDKAGNEILA
ncbi:MAG TPA: DUF1398 family protein, partial [Anseongella sp.]|nr:DUF1398 family protein [Anseongella sp.]